MLSRIARLLVLVLAMAGPAHAAMTPDEMLDDPALEARARDLGKQLRCLVCQNQSIDDSDADLAKDLRAIVRERLIAGDSDEAIKDYLVARYGAFVLLEPPVMPSTWALWAGPFVILLAGAGLAVTIVARRRREQASTPPPEELDEAEAARLRHLLGER